MEIDKNDKRDPHDSKRRWETWKAKNSKGIDGVSQYNHKIIYQCLLDGEIGKHHSKQLSASRLNGLASRLTLLGRLLKKSKLNSDKLTNTSDEAVTFLHQIVSGMKDGSVKKSNGEEYKSVRTFLKDTKVLYNYMERAGLTKKNITKNLKANDDKPTWTYLDEEQLRSFGNQCNADYRALFWFFIDAGCRVTEGYSVRVCDFNKDFSQVTIRGETAKNGYERTINLKICPSLIREFIKTHNLKGEDFIVVKEQPAFNKYLRTLAKKLFGDGVSNPKAKGRYGNLSLGDLRHIASCYWLARYNSHKSLMYRMGWTSEKFVKYYSDFLGQSDEITDEDMITQEERTAYEKKIAELSRQNEDIRKEWSIFKELLLKKKLVK